MESSDRTVEFQLDGLQITMTPRGERWVVRAGHSVAVGRSAGKALLAALDPLGKANVRALFADLGLLAPSIAVAEIERSARSA